MTIAPDAALPLLDAGSTAPRQRIFHQVIGATLVNVRQALAGIHSRFDGAVDADALGRLELVLAEVLNNIVLHGAGGQPAAGALSVLGMPDDGVGALFAPPQPFGAIDEAGASPGVYTGPALDSWPIVIHLTVTQHRKGLACAVVDDGSPLPQACLVAPDSYPAPELAALRAGGFGWAIIRDLTRSLFYFREKEQNILCFNVPLQEADPRSKRAVRAR